MLGLQVVDPALEVHGAFALLFITCSLIGMFFITALLIQIFTQTYSQAASTTFTLARIHHWSALVPVFAMLESTESIKQQMIASEIESDLSAQHETVVMQEQPAHLDQCKEEPAVKADFPLDSEPKFNFQLNMQQIEQMLLRQSGKPSPGTEFTARQREQWHYSSTWLQAETAQLGNLLEHLQTKLQLPELRDDKLGKHYRRVFGAIATLCCELKNETHYNTLASMECLKGMNLSLHSACRNISLSAALIRCGLADRSIASQLRFIKSVVGPMSDATAYQSLVSISVPFDVCGRDQRAVVNAAVKNGHISAYMHMTDLLGCCEWLPVATGSITVKRAATEWHQLEMQQRLDRIVAEVHGLDVASKDPVTRKVVLLLQMVQLHKWRLQLMFRSVDQVQEMMIEPFILSAAMCVVIVNSVPRE